MLLFRHQKHFSWGVLAKHCGIVEWMCVLVWVRIQVIYLGCQKTWAGVRSWDRGVKVKNVYIINLVAMVANWSSVMVGISEWQYRVYLGYPNGGVRKLGYYSPTHYPWLSSGLLLVALNLWNSQFALSTNQVCSLATNLKYKQTNFKAKNGRCSS